mmetsp:Transcript_23483/g.23690  ORF Transcript_23483/g.23690 Transcript_23483/m.23690 type:complete len:144 (+) Transcript_23483:249-680(+)
MDPNQIYPDVCDSISYSCTDQDEVPVPRWIRYMPRVKWDVQIKVVSSNDNNLKEPGCLDVSDIKHDGNECLSKLTYKKSAVKLSSNPFSSTFRTSKQLKKERHHLRFSPYSHHESEKDTFNMKPVRASKEMDDATNQLQNCKI